MQLNLGRSLPDNQPFSLESQQLVTHGVILGMTGSGKTGLAITLLEELVEAGVPLMLIDPKGDLANLGLLFPEARPDQLQPWTDPSQDPGEWSQKIQRGRLEWGIGPSQVAALRDRLELRIYTPGSRAGYPVNLLSSFPRPESAVLDDPEARSQLISGTIQSILALVGQNSDPLRSPEALVLSQIVEAAWESGQDLSFEDLVLRLVDPPFKKVGVFPLDTFYPSNQRMELALKLNSLLASPAFKAWTEGEPLEPARLQTARQAGKVPVSLFYLAHLNDGERIFFVSLFLERLRNWSRSLPGSSNLRSLVFFDEVAGYAPPHPANPPSKAPLLTLMKQSRAVGLGVVVATQNPVDLDYKSMGNAGTWCVGRLQTAQDRERVADGLTLAASGLDSARLKAEFEALQPRHFLIKSPDRPEPVRFQTRFARALLRGPITRSELALLQPAPAQPEVSSTGMGSAPSSSSAGIGSSPSSSSTGMGSSPSSSSTGMGSSERLQPPPLPQGFVQAYLDPEVVFSAAMEGNLEAFAEPHRADGRTLWSPALWGEVQLRFDEDKGGFILDELHHYVFFPLTPQLPSAWLRLPLESQHLLGSWSGPSVYRELDANFDESSELKAAQQAMLDDVFRRATSSQWIQADLKLYGSGGESEAEFRDRVQQVVEERIDQQVAKLHAKVDKEIQTLQERLARHENKLETLRNESQRRQTETLWTAGAAVLGLFTGKKRSLGSALTSHHRSSTASDRVSQGQAELDQMLQKLSDLRQNLELQIEEIRQREQLALNKIEARPVRLERSDIRLTRFGILWIPISRRI